MRANKTFFQSINAMIYILLMNLSVLDLNLLVALEALLAEASVGRAATRIGLSQPAASHALRRLRDIVRDPLLVRVGQRMQLTPRAQALRGPLAHLLDQTRSLFIPTRFEPATSRRRFVLMMPDLVVDLLIPPLVERVGRTAPGVRIDVTPWRGPVTLTEEFAQSLDLIIACTGDAYPGFHRQRLYVDRDVLAVRRAHPLRTSLSRLDTFLSARHVAVVGAGEHEDMIDAWLRREGVERPVALVVPSYLQALRMAARTDLVAFVPGRLMAALARPLGLAAARPPLDPGVDEQFMFHPTRAQMDEGSIWLRRLVTEIARALGSPRTRK